MRSSTIKINKHSFETLLAMTDAEQQVGLMYRKELPPSMSFVYRHPKVNKFWMKNTYCPLDIVFISNGKIVQICKGEPLSTASVGPDVLTNLVVEFPYGTCEKLGIRVGDSAELPELVSTSPFDKQYY